LKRFNEDEEGNYVKDNTHVKYPMDDLKIPVKGEDGQKVEVTYELFGVTKHDGMWGFGHYWAACRDPVDNKWYDYNDEVTTPLDTSIPADVDKIVSKFAYSLFYRKKTSE
jgi:ubiquitin C-terminal hydrolase